MCVRNKCCARGQTRKHFCRQLCPQQCFLVCQGFYGERKKNVDINFSTWASSRGVVTFLCGETIDLALCVATLIFPSCNKLVNDSPWLAFRAFLRPGVMTLRSLRTFAPIVSAHPYCARKFSPRHRRAGARLGLVHTLT